MGSENINLHNTTVKNNYDYLFSRLSTPSKKHIQGLFTYTEKEIYDFLGKTNAAKTYTINKKNLQLFTSNQTAQA